MPIKHGESLQSGGVDRRSPEWISWSSMRQRCLNKNHKHYADYGGRGIVICERWMGADGFRNFLADMGRRPTRSHTLDRLDNEKGYSPENCRWATSRQQNSNRRIGTMVAIGGVTRSLSAWARAAGLSSKTLADRYRRGVRGEALLSRAYSTVGDGKRSATHCSHGHEFTPENTRVRPGNKGRTCRACERSYPSRGRP